MLFNIVIIGLMKTRLAKAVNKLKMNCKIKKNKSLGFEGFKGFKKEIFSRKEITS